MAPNFLIFIVDQLCATHLGCYGSRYGATPHIDALARRGWQADECHVASPICMPNRASLVTGRLPSAHGVRHNGIPLSLGARTFVDQLREAGYATALIGKSHLQNITDKPVLPHAGLVRHALDAERPYPGNHRQEAARLWREDPLHDVALPYYGFGHVEFAIEHGDLPAGHYQRWLQAQHPEALALAGRANAQPTPEYALAACGQAWRTRLPQELHPSAWIGERTAQWLRQAAGGNKPFLAYCSFPDPHSPYTPPGRYWDLFRPEDMALPPSFHSRTPPPHLRWLREARDAGRAVKNTMGCFAATEREAREAIALNLGGMAFIDAQIGRVLAELRALGLEQDTVVLFTSDHGEFAGDHQLLLKGPLHYRSLVRTPLLWADPASGGGRRSDALLSTVDIAPSILARAGVEGYNGLQGRSFLPLARGEENGAALRDAVLIEEEGQRTSYGFATPVRLRTLVAGRYRLSVYDGVDWGELYDRAEDPLEARNLWDEPALRPLRAELAERLCREMLANAERSPAPTALA